LGEDAASKSDRPKSIYAPGASKADSGLRIHIGFRDFVTVLTALGLAGGGAAVFKSSQGDVEKAKAEAAATSSAAAASAQSRFDAQNKEIRALRRELQRDGLRWDKLDSWHAKTRLFNQASKTPPPKFGPRAEKNGEAVRLDLPDEDDE